MGLTEASRQVDSIIDDLFISMKKEQVESIFSQNNVEDKAERVQLLRKCMHVLNTSNTVESLSLDDEYNDELEIFLNGKWRFLI